MPIYLFESKDGTVIEVVQRMNQPHVYKSEDGEEWQRIYTIPAAVVDGKLDGLSVDRLVRKSGDMRGSLGDVLDMVRDAKEDRKKQCGGVDPFEKTGKDKPLSTAELKEKVFKINLERAANKKKQKL